MRKATGDHESNASSDGYMRSAWNLRSRDSEVELTIYSHAGIKVQFCRLPKKNETRPNELNTRLKDMKHDTFTFSE